MSGFRELMPGQVYFYYNPNATKEQEKLKELGYVTSRPVVIIQSAFYTEWNDIVTVVPMTHSDRRSGIPIETTLLKDGSLVEGGTVLPYLIYSVKAKFLMPMVASIAGQPRRRLLSLAPEDFEKVMAGVSYHLGFTSVEPSYVQNWKKIPHTDRQIIFKGIKLAVTEWDAIVAARDGEDPNHRLRRNPYLHQDTYSEEIENHIISEQVGCDRETKRLYNPKTESPYTLASVSDGYKVIKPISKDPFVAIVPSPKSTATEDIPVKPRYKFDFTRYDREHFDTFMSNFSHSEARDGKPPKLYPGSNFLADTRLRDMPAMLSDQDKVTILEMPIRDVMALTGINSSSTVSRLRSLIRAEIGDSGLPVKTVVEFSQDKTYPAPFTYAGDVRSHRSRNRRNILRYHAMLGMSEEEMREALTMDPMDLTLRLGLSYSNCKQLRVDITTIHPEYAGTIAAVEEAEAEPTEDTEATYATASAVDGDDIYYELWETLSESEIREFRSVNKKNSGSLAKNFGISKTDARQTRGDVISIVKNSGRRQPIIDKSRVEDVCLRIANSNFSDMTTEDLLIFCRTDPLDIANIYSKAKSSNIPSKSNIRAMKIAARRLIVKPQK